MKHIFHPILSFPIFGIITVMAALFIPRQSYSLVYPETVMKIFQFPSDMIPKIDGRSDDWEIVPAEYTYGSDLLREGYLKDFASRENAKPNENNPRVDTNDLDARVTVGWTKGMNQLYFLYEVYDDYWEFEELSIRCETFEISVDGDLSGGDFIHLDPLDPKYPNCQKGSHAQNFHIWTPPVGKQWSFSWNAPPWLNELPWFNCAYTYDFVEGGKGRLVFECWLTPFDYASFDGLEASVPSKLVENGIIGLSWVIVDYDGPAVPQQYYCLSHTLFQVYDASLLRPFRLMPLEEQFKKPIEAFFTITTIDMDARRFAFSDHSYGEITSRVWDFGDGTTSTEINPVHTYDKTGQYNVILTVQGPKGNSRYWRLWEVLLKDSVLKLPGTPDN